MSVFNLLLDPIPLPRMVKAEQKYPRPILINPVEEFKTSLNNSGLLSRVSVGMSIAITVGSRGVSNQPQLVRALVTELKKVGAEPFIIPAMGSHGGATAEGQIAILQGMDVTEETIGAPIRATMETVILGEAAPGLPVQIDKYAHEADGIIIINRIKPHVAFRGPYESGLAKMIAIGLGKQRGAEVCHRMGFGKMAEHIPTIAKKVIAESNILFAIGTIENAYHETARIEVIPIEDLLELEPALQEESKGLCAKLFTDRLDVLILDEIGKDITGTGFDTNVVGRYHTPFISGGPEITRIAVLNITDRSKGNGNGLGIVDFTTKRAFDKFKFEMSYPNALTSTVPVSVKIPMVLENDRQAIQAAVKTSNIANQEDVRLIRIKNTNEMDILEISESLLVEAENSSTLKILSDPYELKFDANGNLF